MAITTAITDLFKSFYELIASLLGSAYAIVHSIFTAIAGFVTGIFSLFGNVLEGLISAVGGVGKFIAGNVVLLSIGALGAFAFVRYTSQGKRLANTPAAKKTN